MKRTEMWKNKSWIIHQDKVPAHNALSVKCYLAATGSLVLEDGLHSPDLALFFEDRSLLRRTGFQSMEKVK